MRGPLIAVTLLALHLGVSHGDMVRWSKVMTCETKNWHYPNVGGLGILPGTWVSYGGRRFGRTADRAKPWQQVFIAKRINGSYVPDQDGCNGGW